MTHSAHGWWAYAWLAVGAALVDTALSAQPTAAADEQAMRAFGQLPAFEQVALSPDGTKLAYFGTVGSERHVLVKDLRGGRKLVDFTEAPGQKLRGLQWADRSHILATVSMTTAVSLWGGEWNEYFGVIAADLDTGQAWDVLRFPGGLANNVGRVNLVRGRLRAREIDGETWLFVRGFFTSADFQARGRLMKINLARRTHELVESRDAGEQYDSLIDEHGDDLATSDYKEEDGQWWIAAGRGGHLQRALSGEALIDVPALQGISPDGQQAWLLTHANGRSVPVSISLVDGRLAPGDSVPNGVHRAQWEAMLLDRRSDRVVAGVIHGAMQRQYEFLDPVRNRQWQQVLATLGDVRAMVASASDDCARIVVLASGPAGPQYLLIDMDAAQIMPLGPQYRQLPPPAEVRAIEYPAGDGLLIPAYLTLPRGRKAQGLPLVVMPHGGPAARDSGDYDWWAQALAHEGYAVLQANFRGSTVSDESIVAGRGQWGRRMQTDLSDGVRYLAAGGTVDPARVCIVGASYGGYAALAGVSLQHDVYRCAVSVAGVSDLRLLIRRAGGLRDSANIGARYIERWFGVTDSNDASIGARSPADHADGVHVPVLLIHGRDDTVVPYEHSERMAEALARLHRPCTLVDLKAEDHWLSRAPTRLQMLTATLSFLEANNPPDPETPMADGPVLSPLH